MKAILVTLTILFILIELILNYDLMIFYLHTNVSTCVQGSPHLGQVNVFFFPPPVPLEDPPDVVYVSLEGGVGSVGVFPKLPLVVRVLVATILTILCTAQLEKIISYCAIVLVDDICSYHIVVRLQR